MKVSKQTTSKILQINTVILFKESSIIGSILCVGGLVGTLLFGWVCDM